MLAHQLAELSDGAAREAKGQKPSHANGQKLFQARWGGQGMMTLQAVSPAAELGAQNAGVRLAAKAGGPLAREGQCTKSAHEFLRLLHVHLPVHLMYTSLYTSSTPPCTPHVHLIYT